MRFSPYGLPVSTGGIIKEISRKVYIAIKFIIPICHNFYAFSKCGATRVAIRPNLISPPLR